jgi:UDP-N-acetylmuramoyl-L-alanyl-D-glutamate--2,6-diaminopimelate ligase
MAAALGNLATVVPGGVLTGDPATMIISVTADSREAGPGVLFVAVHGIGGDGHRFVAAALAAGAAAVAVETAFAGDLPANANILHCPDTRPVPALTARALHGDPDRRLWTAAVTGTNGKTTTAFLLQEMLNTLRGRCGLLGTIRYDDGRDVVPAPLTTPGGPVFYDLLARMANNGCAAVAMELSSHALDQQRTAGLGLDVAVMTNLGRDHLDYHATLAEYLAAKARIMDLLRPGAPGEGTGRPGVLVLNAGEPALANLPTGDHAVIRYSARPEAEIAADLRVTSAELQLTGTRMVLAWGGQQLELASPLVGRFNVENLTAALAAGIALGLEPADCARALAGVDQVPGRLERFLMPVGAIAVVDYAHTHDALAAVLAACGELTSGRLLLVFGCGGDRDRGKRPLMAAVAAQGSDQVWITSDNPRSEDPHAICAEIAAGYDAVTAPRAAGRAVIVDRTVAIEAALAAAAAGDIVIVAGKGHEDYQLVGDQVLDLDDRLVIREWVARHPATGRDRP